MWRGKNKQWKRKRPAYGKKRFGGKKYLTRPTSLAQPVQYFKRSEYNQQLYNIPSGAGFSNISVVFSLANVPNSSEFTRLYDMYKILGVKYELIPLWNSSNVIQGTTLPALQSSIHSVIDYADSNPLTTLDDYVQYQNYKVTRGSKPHKRYFVPAVQQVVQQNAGVNVAMLPRKKQWINTDNSGVEHLCLKICIPRTDFVQSFDVRLTLYLAFKNVK